MSQHKSDKEHHFFSRLKHAAELRQVSLSWLAAKLGVSRSTLYRYKDGGSPQPRTLSDIAKELKVSEEWLLSGKGEMQRGQIENAANDTGRADFDRIAADLIQNLDVPTILKTLEQYVAAAEAGDQAAPARARFIINELKKREENSK